VYSHNKSSPKVIKSHEDSENRNNISKSSLCGSLDLFPRIERRLFHAMNRFDNVEIGNSPKGLRRGRKKKIKEKKISRNVECKNCGY
jgi:hypothetical protein